MERAEHIGVKEAARFKGVNPGALLTKFRRERIFSWRAIRKTRAKSLFQFQH